MKIAINSNEVFLTLGSSTAYGICTGRPVAGVSSVVGLVETLGLNKFEWLINTKMVRSCFLQESKQYWIPITSGR